MNDMGCFFHFSWTPSASNWWMQGGWNDGKVSDSLLSHEKGVVKSRSILGHFHRLRSASGSQKAHRPRDVPPTSNICLR